MDSEYKPAKDPQKVVILREANYDIVLASWERGHRLFPHEERHDCDLLGCRVIGFRAGKEFRY